MLRTRRSRAVWAAATALATCALLAPPAGAAARIDFARLAYGVLTPGEYGALPATPNSTDQAALWDGLTPLGGNVTATDLGRFYKSERFGLQGAAARVEHPRRGVVIRRDGFDVPHISGRTRDDVMFAAGWAQIEDRGQLMEAGRGPARLAALDAPGLDAFALATSLRQFIPSPQAESFVHTQVGVLQHAGAKGRRVLRDLEDWVAGINAYYAANVPAPSRPAAWTIDDAISAFALIGSVFGSGGGGEVRNANLLGDLQARLGSAAGLATFNDLKETNDPAAPVTITGNFPYAPAPSGATPGSPAIDPGSISATAIAAAAAAARSHALASSALLVSAGRSATGHPLAVMGPQFGYYYPEIVMEMDLHGGGIDVRGAAAAVAPYVLIGRGKDFAWSLTSAMNDNTDQFLEQLCNQDRSPPTRASTSYLYKGSCVPMTPFVAGILKGTAGHPDQTIAYNVTVHGPVSGTVTIAGQPYAIATLRANRGREPAGELALADLNSNAVHSAGSFYRAANEFETTFNCLYVDSRNIAFFSSGRLPIRAPGTNPALPTLGTGAYDWRGFLSQNQHPHGVNPRSGQMLSWNNKPAKGWGAADNNWSQGAIHRVLLFSGFKRRGNRLADVVGVMNRAATQDFRAVAVWPVIARVLGGGPAPGPLAQQAVTLVNSWVAAGASRIDANGDGKIDDPGAAVLDTAWPLIADAVLRPVLGPLTDEFATIAKPDNTPGDHGTSAYGFGWYEYVYRDLRAQLGDRLAGRFSRRYCGGGDLGACRAALWAAVQAAATQLAAAQGPDPTAWRADATAERIVFKPGLIPLTMRWANRPTFQQAISFSGHR